MMNLLRCSRMVAIAWLVVLFSFSIGVSHSDDLRINELLASTSQEDEFGTPLEWIEIYNPGPQVVDLIDYALSDDRDTPRKWNFPPVTLAAGDYLLVYTTGYDFYNPGEYHANFRLGADGEYVGLYRVSDESRVDGLDFPPQKKDVSYGRDPDDPAQWLYLTPTPGTLNAKGGVLGQVPSPIFSVPGGLYASPFTITLPDDDTSSIVRYTLDGSTPNAASLMYQDPISIAQTTLVRACAFRDGYQPSEVITHSYFLGEQPQLPVVSLVTDYANLWDKNTGIYANPSRTGSSWERPASMEYVRLDGSRWFGVNAGLRLHGGASRTKAEKKSFRVYFRSIYGPGKLKVPLIPATLVDNFDSFILRAGFNDSWVHWDAGERQVAVYISDQMGRDVHGDMGSVYSHGIFTELYLDGQYWGLYNLCERIDGDFLSSYYGDSDWDIINDDAVTEGDGVAWNQFTQFVNSTDLRQPDNYQRLLSMIDLEQVTSYYILNIWVQNHDWPHHNWYAARERKSDGKWKLLVWDIEDSFGSGASRGSYNLNTLAQAQQGGILGTLLKKMLQNEEYQGYFMNRLAYFLKTALSEENLLRHLDELAVQVRPAIPHEAERWNQNMGLTVWENALGIARTFIAKRTDVVVGLVTQQLGMPLPEVTPEPVPTPTPSPSSIPSWPQL